MIEPSGLPSAVPLVDRRTMRMTAAYRQSTAGDSAYKGVHTCICGAQSDNRSYVVNGLATSSLAIHYLAYHRKDIPQEELDKVDSLPYGLETPTPNELQAPPNAKPMVIVEAPNIRLSSVSINLDKYTASLRELVEDIAEYVARRDGTDYETTLQGFLQDLPFYVKPTQGNAEYVKKVVEDAAARAGVTNNIQVVAHAINSLPDDPSEGSTAFSVYVTPKCDFTVFMGATGLEIDDVLEGGDTDFFSSVEEQKAYFDIINEIRHPGQTSKGKVLTLYTARPVADRSRYENANTVPANVFLSTSVDDAAGLAEDLGGDREVWEIRVNSKYLVKTLDAPRVQHYQVAGEAPVESIYRITGEEEKTAAKSKSTKVWRRVPPTSSRNLPGRTKTLAPWNKYNINKLMDDILREYYYTFRGYEGPHPWGLRAKPPQPEYRPLKVVDEQAGAAYRYVIQNHLKNPKVRQRFLRTLLELQMLLRGVDPNNPKLVKRRQVSVAAVKDREYLEGLNLKALQKTQKPTADQDKREFYQGLQEQARKGPVFEEWILKEVESAPELSKPLTKWLGTIAQKPGELEKLKDVDLTMVAGWIRQSPSAAARIEKMSVEDLRDAFNDWAQHGEEPQGDFEKNKVVYKFKDGWSVVELETENDILREGTIVQNCLKQPTMDWYSKVQKGLCKLYSLRTPANSPRVDIEVQGKYVSQVYGKQNKPPMHKYGPYLSEFFVAQKLYSGLLLVPNATLTSQMLDDVPLHERQQLANNPDSAASLLALLADDEDLDVRKRVVYNRNTDVATLERMTNDADDWISANAKGRLFHHHPDKPGQRSKNSTDPDELRELAKIDVAAIRYNVARNKATPEDVVRLLAKDDIVTVREAVAARRDLPMDVMAELATDPEDDVLYRIAARSDVTEAILRDLSTSKHGIVRKNVADNPNTPEYMLVHLASDTASIVRAAVAENENTTLAILKVLARDENVDVRLCVARNHNSSSTILRNLAEDEDDDVAEEARATLSEVYGLRS